MTRCVLVATLALGVLAAAPSAGASTSAMPSLRVVSLRPFTVRGREFEPRELVRVTVVSVSRSVRVVRATRGGSFVVDFGAVRIDPCAGFTVFARGSRGSRAVLIREELPECPQPVPPPR